MSNPTNERVVAACVPVSAEHDWVYHPNSNGYGIVECRRCGKFAKYRLTGYKPEPSKEPCYGR